MITSRADGTSRIRSWLWHALADFKYRSLRALSLAARDIISVWVLSFCAKTRPKRDATNIFLHIWRWTNSPGDVESLFGFIEFRKCNEPVAVTISLTTADQLKIGSKKNRLLTDEIVARSERGWTSETIKKRAAKEIASISGSNAADVPRSVGL